LPAAIGRYRVERLIGRGAMGVVYLAHDPVIDRQVAIKLVLAELLAEEEREDFLERFRREAQAAGRCVHANIVTVFDFALHDDSPYLAMEFVDGTSLVRARPGGGPWPAAEAVAVVQQILAGLQAAHALGVVHRDIKPANVLVTVSGQVKITDFGVARLERSGLTQDGTIVGTLSYMSPEQCRGQAVDHRADLFSTACILHELLLGVRPFTGRTEAEVMQRLLMEKPAEPAGHTVSSALLDVVRQGLAKTPEARFPSAAAMASALRAAMEGKASPADVDRTVVHTTPRPAMPQEFDPAALAEIERELAAYLGPIARTMVQSAARRAPSLEALRDMVARDIGTATQREAFLRGMAMTKSGVTPAPSVGATQVLSAAVVEAGQKELTRLIGPIASVVVRRAAAKAWSASEFWDALAAHIDAPAERAAFLKAKP
jgi:serine/threonine-protein kinase